MTLTSKNVSGKGVSDKDRFDKDIFMSIQWQYPTEKTEEYKINTSRKSDIFICMINEFADGHSDCAIELQYEDIGKRIIIYSDNEDFIVKIKPVVKECGYDLIILPVHMYLSMSLLQKKELIYYCLAKLLDYTNKEHSF